MFGMMGRVNQSPFCSLKVFWYIHVIGNSTKIMTPRIPHAIVKELCKVLDISISHKYASI